MSGKVGKNSKGYNYKYTDMGEIHNYLESIDCAYYQYIETQDGEDYIYTVPIIAGEEKPARRGCKIVNAPLKGTSNPAQEQGSAITYARRYSLLMAFGLCTVDDDGFGCRTVKPTAEELNRIEKKAEELGLDYGSILKQYKVKYPAELNREQFDSIEKRLIATEVERLGNE